MAEKLMGYGHFIDGTMVEGLGGGKLTVEDPSSGEAWTTIADATSEDVDAAVRSSRRAFETGKWREYRAADRAQLLIDVGNALAGHSDELADLQVRENGKVRRELLGQAQLIREHFNYYAGLAQGPSGRTNPLHLRDIFNYTRREPLGVVAAVTPWNSPLMLLCWKLGPALAMGNTVVTKPSEVSPVSTLRFAQLAHDAGMPPGVLNVVTGGRRAGEMLVQHEGVNKVSFTGSTAAGRLIASRAGHDLKRVSLELGGKSANIVFADADLTNALRGLAGGIFAAGGQTCVAGSRILLQDEIYDRVVSEFIKRANAIVVGDPMDPATEMGPMASRAQYEKVLGCIGQAIREGAHLVAGGKSVTIPGREKGYFIRPTVFTNVSNSMAIAREEVFGPVAAVLRFSTDEDAIAMANDSPYGLAAGVWTSDVRRAHRVAHALEAGTVWINNYRKTGYSTPFGGYKASGLGRENGPDALLEYSQEKSIWVDTGAGVRDPFNPRAS